MFESNDWQDLEKGQAVFLQAVILQPFFGGDERLDVQLPVFGRGLLGTDLWVVRLIVGLDHSIPNGRRFVKVTNVKGHICVTRNQNLIYILYHYTPTFYISHHVHELKFYILK